MLDHGELMAGEGFDVAAPTLVHVIPCSDARDGEQLALVARVQTLHRGGVMPSGSVAFRVGHRLLGTARLDDLGRATLAGVQLPGGLHAVVASYGGDAGHAPATSAPAPQPVRARVRAVLVEVAPPRGGGDETLLEAQVVDRETGRVADGACGALTFTLNGGLLGGVPLAAGRASLVVPGRLGPGVLGAHFAGDAEHAPARGTAP